MSLSLLWQIGKLIDRLLNINEQQEDEQILATGHIEKRKANLQVRLYISITGLILLNQHLLEGRLPYLALHVEL